MKNWISVGEFFHDSDDCFVWDLSKGEDGWVRGNITVWNKMLFLKVAVANCTLFVYL